MFLRCLLLFLTISYFVFSLLKLSTSSFVIRFLRLDSIRRMRTNSTGNTFESFKLPFIATYFILVRLSKSIPKPLANRLSFLHSFRSSPKYSCISFALAYIYANILPFFKNRILLSFVVFLLFYFVFVLFVAVYFVFFVVSFCFLCSLESFPYFCFYTKNKILFAMKVENITSVSDINENYNYSKSDACKIIQKLAGFSMSSHTLETTLKRIIGEDYKFKKVGHRLYVSGQDLIKVCEF